MAAGGVGGDDDSEIVDEEDEAELEEVPLTSVGVCTEPRPCAKLLRQLFERNDEDAYMQFAGKAINIRIRVRKPSREGLSQLFNELRLTRLAVHEERRRCRRALADMVEPIQRIQEEIIVAETKLQRLARMSELQAAEFARYVQKRYRKDPHRTLHAILDMPLGLSHAHAYVKLTAAQAAALRKQLVAERKELSERIVIDAGQQQPSVQLATEANAVDTPLGHDMAVRDLQMELRHQRVCAYVNAAGARTSDEGTGRSETGSRSGQRCSNVSCDDSSSACAARVSLGSAMRDTEATAGVPLEVKDLLSRLLQHWEQANSFVVQAKQQAGVRTKGECEDFFADMQALIPRDAGLFSEGTLRLLNNIVGGADKGLKRLLYTDFEMVMEDLTTLLDKFFLPVFLTSESFLDFLRKAGNERLFGGLTKRAKAGSASQVVADQQGHRRADADADEYMDSRFVHGGQQRVKVSVVYPLLQRRLRQLQHSVLEAKATLPLLLEHVYNLAVPIAQRAWRGHRGREKARITFMRFSKAALCASAVQIQRVVRGYAVRATLYPRLMAARKNKAALIIQTRVRQFLAKCRVGKMVKTADLEVKTYKVGAIQKLWRVWVLKKRLEDFGKRRQVRLLQEDREWAAKLIQRVYRGHLARAYIVSNHRIELGLDHDLLKMAEKYAVDGDLQRLLTEANGLLKAHRDALAVARHNEEDRAETFRAQLKLVREKEHQGHWRFFTKALMALQKRDHAELVRSQLFKVNTSAAAKQAALTTDDMDLMCLRRAIANWDGALEREYGIPRRPSFCAKPPPLTGPSIRVRQVMVEKEKQLVREFGRDSATKLEETERRYGVKVKVKCSRGAASTQKRKALALTTEPTGELRSRPIANRQERSVERETRQAEEHTPRGSPPSAQSTLRSPKGPTSTNIENRFKWHLPALELWSGLDEPVERFMPYAVLRCFVPPGITSPGESAQDAYHHHLHMPPCLAKVQYERQALIRASNVSMKLRSAGVRVVRDLLAVNTEARLLAGLGIDDALQAAITDVAKEIEGLTVLGKYGTAKIMERYDGLKQQQSVTGGTSLTGLTTSSSQTPSLRACIHQMPEFVSNDARVEAEETGALSPISHENMRACSSPTAASYVVPSTELTQADTDLLQWSQGGTCLDMLTAEAPCTWLFTVTAFNVMNHGDEDMSALIQRCSAVHDKVDREQLIRNRLNECVTTVAQLVKKLEVLNVRTVKDTMGVDFSTWIEDKCLLAEVNKLKAQLICNQYSLTPEASTDNHPHSKPQLDKKSRRKIAAATPSARFLRYQKAAATNRKLRDPREFPSRETIWRSCVTELSVTPQLPP